MGMTSNTTKLVCEYSLKTFSISIIVYSDKIFIKFISIFMKKC